MCTACVLYRADTAELKLTCVDMCAAGCNVERHQIPNRDGTTQSTPVDVVRGWDCLSELHKLDKSASTAEAQRTAELHSESERERQKRLQLLRGTEQLDKQ